MRLRLKRIISGSLALCLATLVILSAPLEARAAAQDFLATASNAEPIEIEREPIISIEEPEYLEDDLDEILGAGANCIDDFDPDSLEPLTPEQIEAALNPEPVEDDPNLDNAVNDSIETLALIEVAAGVAAAMAIMWAIGCSAVKTSDGDTFYNKLCSFADSFTSVNFNYILKNTAKSAIMNQAMFVGLKAKLDKSKSADGYSVSLSDEDKLAFAYTCYALNKSNAGLWSLQDLKPTNVNVKAVDGFKYYYFSPDSYVTPTSNVPVWYKVTYTPEKAALGMISQNNVYLYYRNAATADYGFSQMKVHDSKYSLSKSTGLYEYNTGTTRDYVSTGQRAWYNIFYQSMPFPISSGTNVSEKLATYITTKDALLLDYTQSWRCGSLNSLMGLSSVTLKGDIYNTVKSEKNVFAITSALNSAAGIVTDTKTDTGTDTKPGTNTGTDTKPGTTTADLSGVMTELQTLRGIITTLQTNISTMQTTMTSVLAELQEIKAALKDISAGVTTKVDLSPVVDVLEDVQADVIDIRDTIEVLRAEVAYQQELITDIKTNVATIPALIDDVRAEVKAIPGVIDGVRADVKVLTDTLLDVYPALDTMTGTITDTGAAVGSKVDALPGAITDTMTGAIVTDLTQAQTSKDWGMTSPFFDRFPFSIPWDVAGCFSLLVADPIKPIWKIPFKIDNPAIKVDEEVVIDLSGDEWQGPIKVVRAFILIAFIAALAVITRALIKG